MRAALRVLGVATSFCEISFVFFENGDLRYWRSHRQAARGLDTAFELTRRWLAKYQPLIVVVPDYDQKSRKGTHARALVEVVAAAADDTDIACIRAERPPIVKNKYREAALLAVIYPILTSRVPPPRRAWNPERRGILLFEAVAITHHWLWQDTPETLPLF